MKFYNKRWPKQVVWDLEKEKPLCRFKGGVIDTKDDKIIGVLTKLGYERDIEVEYVVVDNPVDNSVKPVDNFDKMSYNELIALAKERNVDLSAGKKKTDVIKALKEQ